MKSPLAPQPVPQKLDSMPPSKGHSREYTSNHFKLSVPIPEGSAFGKWWGAPFENERIGAKNPSEITLSTPAGTPRN